MGLLFKTFLVLTAVCGAFALDCYFCENCESVTSSELVTCGTTSSTSTSTSSSSSSSSTSTTTSSSSSSSSSTSTTTSSSTPSSSSTTTTTTTTAVPQGRDFGSELSGYDYGWQRALEYECYAIVVGSASSKNISRGCAPGGATYCLQDIESNTTTLRSVLVCSTDGCNSASGLHLSVFIVAVSVVAMIFKN